MSTENSSYYPEYDGLSAVELGQAMEGLNAEIEEAEEHIKQLKARYKELTTYRIPKALEAEGLKNFRLASGRGITTAEQYYVSVRAEDKPEFLQYLRDHGQGSLIKEDVNAQTLKAYIKGCVKDGLEYPASIVNVTVMPVAQFFK